MPQHDTPVIRTPYTDLSPITRMLCESYEDWEASYVGASEWSYTNYLQQRWDNHVDFINVEHDIVFWPGALEELWSCPQEWCYYAYDLSTPQFPYLGCTKIKATLMDKAPTVWEDQRRKRSWEERPSMPPWAWCDGWLHQAIPLEIGHLHRPGVVNANNAAWIACRKCKRHHPTYSPCS